MTDHERVTSREPAGNLGRVWLIASAVILLLIGIAIALSLILAKTL